MNIQELFNNCKTDTEILKMWITNDKTEHLNNNDFLMSYAHFVFNMFMDYHNLFHNITVRKMAKNHGGIFEQVFKNNRGIIYKKRILQDNINN